MEFYRGNQVVAVAEQAKGNESVGTMWLDTAIFTRESTLDEVLDWAERIGCGGKLILTMPRPTTDQLYE